MDLRGENVHGSTGQYCYTCIQSVTIDCCGIEVGVKHGGFCTTIMGLDVTLWMMDSPGGF